MSQLPLAVEYIHHLLAFRYIHHLLAFRYIHHLLTVGCILRLHG
ncbi:MAG: hypothetical protein WAZ38_11270 [Prolixibacteraceae bacterium]